MEAVGELPEPKQLERLADLLLYEELSNTHPDKMAREEYPIMSEHQLSRRHSGEVSMKVAEEYGSDRRNYKPLYVGNEREKKRGKLIGKRSLGTRRDGRCIESLRECRRLKYIM